MAAVPSSKPPYSGKVTSRLTKAPISANPAHDARVFVTAQGQQHDAEGDRRPDGQAQQSHFYSSPTR
jgi:hypothetical protein